MASNSRTLCVGEIPDLTTQIRTDEYPCAAGGFADIWTGYWVPEASSARHKVAVKVLRFYTTNAESNRRMEKILRNELRVWRRLKHPHILPLYGTISFGPRVAMVCPWQENGNLNRFLEVNGALEPIERYQILLGVLSGLLYLHFHSIIHGDLTGSNILLGAEGARSVVLSDFGLSARLKEELPSESTRSLSTLGSDAADQGPVRRAGPELMTIHGRLSSRLVKKPSFESFCSLSTLGSDAAGQGSVRWASPEIIIDNGRPTKASDVHSFGRVGLQVLSGSIPYYHITNDRAVIHELSNGVDPPRSLYPDIKDDVWQLIQWCSARKPQHRPMLITVWRNVKRLYDIAEIENWHRGVERMQLADEDEDWQVKTIGYGTDAFV